MIDFYSIRSASPNIRKVLIMLAETGLPYTVKVVERQSDGKFVDEFAAISPNATVPAIVDQDTGSVVFESGAILHYLAEKTGKLLPAGLHPRADVIKWLMFEVANVGPVMSELYHYLLADADNLSDAHLQRYKDKLARYCATLDRQLENKSYLCGDYSIADIALYPWSVILEDMAEISLNDYPNLYGWAARIGRRPAALTAL